MQHSVSAKMKAPSQVKRGRVHRAVIEKLNGGGYKTTVHHKPADPNAERYGPSPEPVESAHKTYKAARKHMDEHFSDEPMEDGSTPEAQ